MTETVKLADVAEILRGTVPANTVEYEEGPRFFGISEITSAGEGESRFAEQGTDLSRAVYLEEGDVVISLLGRIGESTVVPASTLDQSWVVSALRSGRYRRRPRPVGFTLGRSRRTF